MTGRREREIDGFHVWVGATQLGPKEPWFGTIEIRKGESGPTLRIHGLHARPMASADAAMAHAAERVAAIQAITPNGELRF